MKCPKCESHISSSSIFCKYCGFKIPQKPKYIRSKSMKAAMKIMIAGLFAFAVGMLLVLVLPSIGIVIFAFGAIALVGGSIAYLIAEFQKKRKDEERMAYSHPTCLPIEPIVISPSTEFALSGMEQVQSYFEQAFSKGSSDGFCSVMFNHSLVLQIIDCSNDSEGRKHEIGIFFFPYLYDDSELMERFEDNHYKHYFSNNPLDSEEGADAYFGADIKKAIRVASYILATVYYIPLDTKLYYDFGPI